MPKTKKRRKYNTKRRQREKMLREKIKDVNKLIKDSHKYLNKNHSVYAKVRQSKKLVYAERRRQGKRAPALFTLKDVPTKAWDRLDALLDTILNSTYLNEGLYEKYHRAQEDNLIDKGITDSREHARAILDVLENDLFDKLKELGVNPSECMELIGDSTSFNYNSEKFYAMVKDFFNSETYENEGATGFFEFAEWWEENDKYEG